MKIGIHHSKNSYSERWIEYCKFNNISYKVIDCYQNDIIQQVQDCDIVMWHFYHANEKDTLFAKQLLYAIAASGKKVFPDFNTGWHFDDKVAQKYLMESLDLPLVPSYVFYTKEEALIWANHTSFPKVFKLRGGAGSVNVKLVKSFSAAESLINKAFGKGFKHDSLVPLKEIFQKYKKGKVSFISVLKGTARTVIPTQFSKINGREIGYIYFQDFIPNNDHDIRVIVIGGDKSYAIKRMVREDDFRASGSGNILYQKELFDDAIIKLSFDIADKLQSKCLALDYVFENGKQLVVEISFGFSMAGYDPCPGYWDSNLEWHEGKFNPYGWMIDNVIKSVK